MLNCLAMVNTIVRGVHEKDVVDMFCHTLTSRCVVCTMRGSNQLSKDNVELEDFIKALISRGANLLMYDSTCDDLRQRVSAKKYWSGFVFCSDKGWMNLSGFILG